MDESTEAVARRLARNIRARKRALGKNGETSAPTGYQRNDERLRITGMMQALAVIIDQAGSRSAAEDFCEHWRHDDLVDIDTQPPNPPMTKSQLRTALRVEGGAGNGTVYIRFQGAHYFLIERVTIPQDNNDRDEPCGTIIEAGVPVIWTEPNNGN